MKTLVVLLLILLPVGLRAQKFYNTPSGKKYHAVSCRMVEHTSTAVGVDDIRRLGLGPCSICRPGAVSAGGSRQGLMKSSRGAAVGEGTRTAQCRGYTKAGARCRHRTAIADGYCYQHRPR